MMTRALLLFSCAFILILFYEYVYHRSYKDKQVPLALGFFVVFCVIVFRISGAYIGALAAIKFFPNADSSMASIRTAAGLFAGIWSAAILLQLAQNAVRSLIGEPTIPISFTRISPPKPAQHNKK